MFVLRLERGLFELSTRLAYIDPQDVRVEQPLVGSSGEERMSDDDLTIAGKMLMLESTSRPSDTETRDPKKLL